MARSVEPPQLLAIVSRCRDNCMPNLVFRAPTRRVLDHRLMLGLIGGMIPAGRNLNEPQWERLWSHLTSKLTLCALVLLSSSSCWFWDFAFWLQTYQIIQLNRQYWDCDGRMVSMMPAATSPTRRIYTFGQVYWH